MKKEKTKKKKKIINIFCWICYFVACLIIFGLILESPASKDIIQPLSNESNYPVYSGKNVYEYWKTTLSEDRQLVYDELKESFLQFKKDFSVHIDGNLSLDDFKEIYTAVLLDHPEMFWMYSYSVTTKFFSNDINTSKKIKLEYSFNEEESKDIKKRISPKYEAIINEAKKLESDYDKIKYVHDELIRLGVYTKYDADNLVYFQSLISIFDTGETVCSGYSYGFKFIMDNLGIDCILTRDVSNEDVSKNHIWNMVKLDGIWYNIDLTYDGNVDDEYIYYKYFLKDNEEFYKNHKMQDKIPQNK